MKKHFRTATPSPAALQYVADNFQDLANQSLDDLMQGDSATLSSLIDSYCEAHLLAANKYAELATLPVAALKNVSISASDLVQDADAYTVADVIGKFNELGFRTASDRIFYDHPAIGAEKPAPAPLPQPTRADEVTSYLQTSFVGNVMESRDIDSLMDALHEYNSQNEYNQCDRSYKPAALGLADFRNLSVSGLFNSDDEVGHFYNIRDFTQKLTDLGFVLDGDRLEGHRSVIKAKPGTAPKI